MAAPIQPTPAPAAPAPAPAAPAPAAAPESASGLLQLDNDAFANIMGIRDAVGEQPAQPAPEGEPPNPLLEVPIDDVTGEPDADAVLEGVEPPAKPKGQEAPPQPPPEQAQQAEGQAKKDEPEPEPEPPARQPEVEFAVSDAEGPIDVGSLLDLDVSYKANGQQVTRKLDRVVRMAQMGEYNAEREAKVEAAARFVAEAQQQVEQSQATIQEYQQFYERLLTDEAFLERARQNFALQNTPEARAERARLAQAQQAERDRETAEAQTKSAFAESVLLPRITAIEAECPLVTTDEVIGRFTILTAPFLVRGVLPLTALRQVQQIVEVDLRNWAQQLQLSRESTQQTQSNRVQAERTKTALAKRQAARAVQPPPAASAAPGSGRPKEFATADDWLNAVLPVRRPA